jgi:type VI secretion system protein ImpE
VSKATDLFAAGKLQPAIEALAEELRDDPGNAQLRTSLFEFLCFAGNWDWAEKQLYALSGGHRGHRVGTLLYLAAIRAERTRHQMFEKEDFPWDARNSAVAGSCNGKEFSSLRDTDSRIGGRLEVIAGETYLRIPFTHLASLEIPPPRRARDLLWTPAVIRRGAAFQGVNLGEVLLPVLSPFSWRHPRDEVRLGRMTIWEPLEDGSERPYGQKMLMVDGEEMPILEIRKLEIRQA